MYTPFSLKKAPPLFSKVNIARLVYFYKNVLLLLLERILFDTKIHKDPKNICIYRVGNVGDIICSLPVFQSIRERYPNARITLLTSPGNKESLGAKELLEGASCIDDLMVYYSEDIGSIKDKYRLSTILRRKSFDLWITIPVELWNLRTMVRNLFFIKFCGIKKAIGFKYTTFQKLTKYQIEYLKFSDEVDKNFNILSSYGLSLHRSGENSLLLETKNIDNLFNLFNLDEKYVVGFVPGAKRLENMWPVDRFVELSNCLNTDIDNLSIVVIGGSDDFLLGEEIKERSQALVFNLCGKTALSDLHYLTLKIDLLISNNTGPMHMSAQNNKRLIGLFSSAEMDGKWFPHGENARILMKRIKCEGCYYNCQNNFQCMADISVSDVVSAINHDQKGVLL